MMGLCRPEPEAGRRRRRTFSASGSKLDLSRLFADDAPWDAADLHLARLLDVDARAVSRLA